MDTLRLIAFIARMVMTVVFCGLFFYFRKGYNESKKTDMKNTYFLGFMLLFGILMIFNLLWGIYGFYVAIEENPIDLDANFSWWEDPGTAVDILANQMRPLYLMIYFLLTCILAAQVYPLEQAMGWKKSKFSKFMVICGSAVWLLYIPAIALSYVAFLLIGLCWFGVLMSFALNIGVNFKIYAASVGALRKRALYAIFAFFLLAVGMLWSLELGWGELIHDSIRGPHDVIIGNVMLLISALFYLKGFSMESFK